VIQDAMKPLAPVMSTFSPCSGRLMVDEVDE